MALHDVESAGTRLEALLEISALRNPFDYANPVRSGDLFAGRHVELSRISYVLDQAGPDHPAGYIALHGQRAAGKTSLLNMTQTLARQRGYVTARLDLVPADADPVAFFAKAYEAIIGAVGEAVGLTASDGRKITSRLVRRVMHGGTQDDFPLEFPENVAQAWAGGRLSEMALRADLEYLAEQAGQPIVLLVDEAQLVADRKDVLSMLRTLGTQLCGYVFVLAGTTDLLVRISEVFDALLRQFEPIKVEQFNEVADVHNCVMRPLRSLGLDSHDCFEDFHGVVQDLMSLTDGNPYEIQFFCHVMFHRWQSGETSKMVLSPGTLDSVREVMEVGGQVQDRPLISAVRKMSVDELVALNLLCSSLESSTVDELWFSHCITGAPSISREAFDGFRDGFVAKRIVEIDDGAVRLPGDLFDHIYVRLWTLNKIGQPRHPQLVSRYRFRALLTRRLEYALEDVVTGRPVRLLSTCCYGMTQGNLESCLELLDSLPDSPATSARIQYLHEAIVRCRFPAALDVTVVQCTYAGTTAVRWLYARDVDDIELTELPAFRAARERASALGGELRAERMRLPLKPWPDVRDWLVEHAGPAERSAMAGCHITESFDAYADGDVSGTVEHLSTAFRFEPSWMAANNLAYLALVRGEPMSALDWAEKAIPLTDEPKARALSRYNAAMALVKLGELAKARQGLDEAAGDLAPLPVPDYICRFLLVPQWADGGIGFEEKPRVNLPRAIDTALDMVGLTERHAGLRQSTE
ncbi:ATP-binding protein [Saccharopolyspora elongata]|uniref:ATP-binding protein n=1 Tax=Saccharopolyspora elongata TaxID=2530387 RepID=UPI00140534EA|nr:ATP-binding protein [Saccharopolyspora elongata]